MIVHPMNLHLPGRLARITAMPLALVLALGGCGGDGGDHSSSEPAAQTLTVRAPETPAAGTDARLASVPGAPSVVAAGESLSPDLTASASDTLAAPGESVQIVARGTPDVKEVVLWDGIHDRQAFAYDSTRAEWHGSYRMPLAPASERVALSVTATNGADRWRRVWIFLSVEKPKEAAGVTPQP